MSTLRTYVIVPDFGYAKYPRGRTTIHDLGDCAAEYCASHPDTVVLAQSETYQYLRERHRYRHERLRQINVGQAGTNGTTGGGTYHVLREAARMMRQESPDCTKAFVVAHDLHARRVIKQGKLFGLELIALPNLPHKFYSTADQWWCRNRWLWYAREILGYPFLRYKGQI